MVRQSITFCEDYLHAKRLSMLTEEQVADQLRDLGYTDLSPEIIAEFTERLMAETDSDSDPPIQFSPPRRINSSLGGSPGRRSVQQDESYYEDDEVEDDVQDFRKRMNNLRRKATILDEKMDEFRCAVDGSPRASYAKSTRRSQCREGGFIRPHHQKLSVRR